MKKKVSNKNVNKMMKQNWLLSICFAFLIASGSCDDIFEEDITEDEIFLLAPANGVSVKSDSTLTFAWDFLNGATEYQIQIVEPSFEAAGILYLDSITTANKVNFSLPPGNYEWGLRGFNSGYSTAFFINAFTVEDSVISIPISDQEIEPLTPRGVISSSEVFFWWEEVENAKEYQLQIVSPDFEVPTRLFYDTIISEIGVKLNLESGKYSWRVRALNEQSRTEYQSLAFEVNTNADATLIGLLRPREGTKTNALMVDFSWEAIADVDFYVLNVAGLSSQNIITENNAISISITAGDGSYDWSITAFTNDQQTIYSDTLSFEYVSGPPAAPELISPASEAMLSGQVNFNWNRSLDSILGDSLFLFDSGMNLLSGFPRYTNSQEFIGNGLNPGDYQWQVKSVDQDGRVGEASVVRSFSIQ